MREEGGEKGLNSFRHGTRCAGEVAAVFNNSQCIVGIAYEAKIGGKSKMRKDRPI